MQYGAHYPRSCADFDDVRDALDRFVVAEHRPAAPLIETGDRVVTLGSCFAVNLGRHLQRHGIPTTVNRLAEDSNSPLANRLLVEYLIDAGAEPGRTLFAAVIDDAARRAARDALQRAQCIVFTVGVALSCFDRDDDQLVLSPYGPRRASYDWQFAAPHEVAADLTAIRAALRTLAPTCRFVVTLSPVPLYRGVLSSSPFIDDCTSKSILRTGLHQFLQQDDDPTTFYWPSFEMIRWCGAHLPPVYGGDDDLPRHVSDAMVDHVVALFVRHCTALPDLAPDPLAEPEILTIA